MSTMFGALNRFISRLDSEGPSQNSRDRSGYGFQVLRNKNPEIPLEPWYDIVVGLNNRQLDSADPNLFATEVRNCAGSSVSLTVWSAKGSRSRILTLPVPTPSPTLGLTLQWTPLSVTEDVWHVLDVIANSPADNAGLLPYGDYIVGTPEGNVHGESGLGELVEDYLGRSLRLYVYNHEYAVTRLITLTPSRSWGGSGALGCVLGFGALHRLPAPMEEPIAAADGTVFESARFSNEENRPSSIQPAMQSSSYPPPSSATQSSDMLVPAAMTSPPPPPPQSATISATAGPPKGTTRKPRAAAASNMTFDEYFREGEQKSKEEDFAPRTKSVVPPPPPPKSAKAPPQAKSPEPVAETGEEGEEVEQAEPEPETESEIETEPGAGTTDG